MKHTDSFKIQMKKRNILKDNKGAALAWVLIAFVVFSILIVSIAFLSRQNILEVVKQEERLQTYYIAAAGVDLTYAALMDLNKDVKRIDKIIIENIDNKPGKKIIETIVIETNGQERGTAVVTIDRITTREKEIDINWLRITSVGLLKDKETTVSSVMRINEKNINQTIRERL